MKAKQTELKKVYKGKWIPNALTISRLVFAVAIVVVLIVKPYNWGIDHDGIVGIWDFDVKLGGELYNVIYYAQFSIAGGLFILGCLTDFLDGYLSRKYNWVSTFGKIMDPVADKVLINSTLIMLSVYNLVFVWITILLIARDVLVDATRMVKAKDGIVVPANIWGKLKTVFEMLGILVFFLGFNRYRTLDGFNKYVTFHTMYNDLSALINVGMYLALIFSITSGVIYEVNMLKKPTKKAR